MGLEWWPSMFRSSFDGPNPENSGGRFIIHHQGVNLPPSWLCNARKDGCTTNPGVMNTTEFSQFWKRYTCVIQINPCGTIVLVVYYTTLIVPDCKVVNVYYIFQPVWYKEVLLQVPGKASPYPNCLQVSPPGTQRLQKANLRRRQLKIHGRFSANVGSNVEHAMLLFLEVTLGMASWVNLLLQWLEECSFVCVT